MNPDPCFCPSKPNCGDGGGDGGGGVIHARDGIVGDCCGGVGGAKGASVDFGRGCDRLEGVRSVVLEVQLGVRSRNQIQLPSSSASPSLVPPLPDGVAPTLALLGWRSDVEDHHHRLGLEILAFHEPIHPVNLFRPVRRA